MGYMNDSPLISIEEWEVQALVKKHFGLELTDKECETLFHMFNTDLCKVDDGGWEGAVAHVVQALLVAIGTIIGDSRHSRSKL
jgi:hypothetical protein